MSIVSCVIPCPDLLSLCLKTQRHWGTTFVRPEPKSRIKRLSEGGGEGEEVYQCVKGDCVEGQQTSRIVHIHCYSLRRIRRGEGVGDGCSVCIVTDRVVIIIGAEQTPGMIIHSKHTVTFVSSPADSFVAHWYINLSSPFHLPVTTTGQITFTQQLRPPVESVRVIRIRLVLLHTRHLPVVVGQFELSVDCVCVERELTGIWWRRTRCIAAAVINYICWFTDGGSWHQRSEIVKAVGSAWMKFKTHLHFHRPGLKNLTPAGFTLKREVGQTCSLHFSVYKHGLNTALSNRGQSL